MLGTFPAFGEHSQVLFIKPHKLLISQRLGWLCCSSTKMCIGHKAKIRDKIPMRSSFLLLPWGEGKGYHEYVGVSAPKPPCPSQRLLLSLPTVSPSLGLMPPHPLGVTQGQLPSMGSSCYKLWVCPSPAAIRVLYLGTQSSQFSLPTRSSGTGAAERANFAAESRRCSAKGTIKYTTPKYSLNT